MEKGMSFVVLALCLWGVLDPRLKTRTVGTLGLSVAALLAVVNLCK